MGWVPRPGVRTTLGEFRGGSPTGTGNVLIYVIGSGYTSLLGSRSGFPTLLGLHTNLSSVGRFEAVETDSGLLPSPSGKRLAGLSKK